MTPRVAAPLLWILLALFALRVLAQLIQRLIGVAWLPPFDAWQSGALPYGLLLASQIAILALQIAIARRVSSGRFRASARAGRAWLAAGALYFAVMGLRLGLGVSLLASHPWWGARLPALFHLVLAGFVLCVGALHRPGGRRISAPLRAGALGRRGSAGEDPPPPP